MMVCSDGGVDGDWLVVRLLDDRMGFLGEGLFCFGFTSDIAIQCSLVDISIGKGGSSKREMTKSLLPSMVAILRKLTSLKPGLMYVLPDDLSIVSLKLVADAGSKIS